jgi:hypothetical protein
MLTQSGRGIHFVVVQRQNSVNLCHGEQATALMTCCLFAKGINMMSSRLPEASRRRQRLGQ